MSDCLDNAQCAPTPSQAFPAPLPTGIPADTITYSFEGICPEKSGLDACLGAAPISVSDALDTLERKLCTLNPKGISQAPSCSPIVVKNGVATPVSPLEALNCLPKLVANDTVFFNGVEWIVGQPVIDADDDCIYPCPPAPNLTLVSTGVNTATWQSPASIAVTDTSSVDLTIAAGVLSAVVKLDPDVANIATIGPNGLKVTVPTATPLDCATLAPLLDPASITTCYPLMPDTPVRILSTGPSGIGYRNLPSVSDATVVSDTATLDLTLTGNNISGSVIVSPDNGNALVANANGLFVPAGTPTVSDTPSVDLTQTGNDISAAVKVSTDAGNAVTVTPTGLFVPLPSAAVAVTVTDSPSVDLTLTGQDISAAVKISPDAGNTLVQNANGLFVPPSAASTPVTVTDTPSIDLTISGQNISASVLIDPIAGNRLSLGPNGLKVAPLDCSDISGLLDPNDPNTCYPVKADTPTRILSTGATGIGYRNLPSGAAPPTVSDTTSVDLTQTGNDISATVKLSTDAGNVLTVTPTGLFVPTPSGGGGGTIYSPVDTNSIDTSIAGSLISSDLKVDPIAGNLLSVTTTGTKVLLDCPTVTAKLAPSTNGGCFPTIVSCNTPDAVFGHKAGVPGYYELGRELYQAETYPLSPTSFQDLSLVGSTLNDITTLMALSDESGLCGLPSMYDPALGRFTLTRAGRYTVSFSLFMRIRNTAGTSANTGLYAGLRFVRPPGTVDGRTVSNRATTLRGSQFDLAPNFQGSTHDYTSSFSGTFLATAGTQLSLRAVCTQAGGGSIASFSVRGDSGHFTVSELPLRSYS